MPRQLHILYHLEVEICRGINEYAVLILRLQGAESSDYVLVAGGIQLELIEVLGFTPIDQVAEGVADTRGRKSLSSASWGTLSSPRKRVGSRREAIVDERKDKFSEIQAGASER